MRGISENSIKDGRDKVLRLELLRISGWTVCVRVTVTRGKPVDSARGRRRDHFSDEAAAGWTPTPTFSESVKKGWGWGGVGVREALKRVEEWCLISSLCKKERKVIESTERIQKRPLRAISRECDQSGGAAGFFVFFFFYGTDVLLFFWSFFRSFTATLEVAEWSCEWRELHMEIHWKLQIVPRVVAVLVPGIITCSITYRFDYMKWQHVFNHQCRLEIRWDWDEMNKSHLNKPIISWDFFNWFLLIKWKWICLRDSVLWLDWALLNFTHCSAERNGAYAGWRRTHRGAMLMNR